MSPRSRRRYRCTYTLYLATSRGLVRNVFNASGKSICIVVRVTLEEFALSTCVIVALHGPTAVRSTWCASTERPSTLIKSTEILFAITLPGIPYFIRSHEFSTIQMFCNFRNSCIIISCRRAIKIIGFNGSVYPAVSGTIGYC